MTLYHCTCILHVSPRYHVHGGVDRLGIRGATLLAPTLGHREHSRLRPHQRELADLSLKAVPLVERAVIPSVAVVHAVVVNHHMRATM